MLYNIYSTYSQNCEILYMHNFIYASKKFLPEFSLSQKGKCPFFPEFSKFSRFSLRLPKTNMFPGFPGSWQPCWISIKVDSKLPGQLNCSWDIAYIVLNIETCTHISSSKMNSLWVTRYWNVVWLMIIYHNE